MSKKSASKKFKILSINPGSTTTKVAIYQNNQEFLSVQKNHSNDSLSHFESILDQYEFRFEIIERWLKSNKISKIDAVVARGGLIKPVPGGVYYIDDNMIHDLKTSPIQHASNLGALIAREFSKKYSVPSYIVDPVVVDEMDELARFSGHPDIKRYPIFHALNQKAVAKRYAEKSGKNYEKLHLIVCHMGGGITIGAHKKGKVVDVNNALTGEGPFTPERSGSLPCYQLIDLLKEKKKSISDIYKMLRGDSGLIAYTGTNNVRDIREKINQGNEKLKLILDSMIYQIAKEIGSMASVLKGKADRIILTGGIAHDSYVVKELRKYVQYIAKVIVYPGEDELQALASGVLRVLQKKETPKNYRDNIIKRP